MFKRLFKKKLNERQEEIIFENKEGKLYLKDGTIIETIHDGSRTANEIINNVVDLLEIRENWFVTTRNGVHATIKSKEVDFFEIKVDQD